MHPPGSWLRWTAVGLVAIQSVVVVTLVLGLDTLVLRDVLTTHVPMKVGQAAAWRDEAWPLLDLTRGGGQPLAGNPNALPFYPSSLLLLVASPGWALNAHFWLHFLLAPWSFYALGRVGGLRREGALMAAAAYTFSGFFLSQMSFANLIAGATWTPALLAVAVLVARRATPARVAALAALWALLLCAGDPTLAALAAGAGLAWGGWEARRAERVGRGAVWLVASFGAGTLLALPQLVEMARVLPTSIRAVKGLSTAERTVASFDPRQAVEWLLPTFFGRLDRVGEGAFWGHAAFTGALPFFVSLAPGALVLALVAVAGRRALVLPAWALVGAGLFLALGRFNPLLAWGRDLPGLDLLRFPVKAWLWVAVGLALLAGAGFQRWLEEPGGAVRRRVVGGLALQAALALGLTLLARRQARAWLPDQFTAGQVAAEASRWLGVVGAAVAVILVAASLGVAMSRRPRLAGALLLCVHAVGQLWLLDSTLARDRVGELETMVAESRAQGVWPDPGARVAHSTVSGLFAGPGLVGGVYPGPEVAWLARRGAAEAFPFAAGPGDLGYELAPSPEGLDSFLTRLARDSVRLVDDATRVRLLGHWGIDTLLVGRSLDLDGLVEVGRWEVFGTTLVRYRFTSSVPRARLVYGVHGASDPNQALTRLVDPGFDPTGETVIAAAAGRALPGAGKILDYRERGARVELTVEGDRDGFVVLQRTHQPLYRAEVDGAPVEISVADLHRIGIPVPAGRHTVRLDVDRGPSRWAAAGSLAGLLALLGLGLGARRAGGAML